MTHRDSRLFPVFLRALLIASVGLAMVACKSKDDPAAAEPTPPGTRADPAPAQAQGKPSDAAKRPAGDDSDPSLKAHMRGHFAAIRQIQRAIVSGGVDVARQAASTLAEHEGHDSIAEYDEELKDVRAAARELASVDSLTSAATITARLVGECGNCHSMMTKIVSFEWHDAPAETGDTKQRMQRHLWAMERLWEGLVGPSDRLWEEGSSVLAQQPLPAAQIAIDPKTVPQVEELAGKLQTLGKQATTTEDQAERIEVYGNLLQLCATCHGIARKPQP